MHKLMIRDVCAGQGTLWMMSMVQNGITELLWKHMECIIIQA